MTDDSPQFDDVWGKLMSSEKPEPVEPPDNTQRSTAHLFVDDFDAAHAPEVEAIMEALGEDLRTRLRTLIPDGGFEVSVGVSLYDEAQGVSGIGTNEGR